MSEIKRIGIDPSKAVFTLHAVDQADRPVLRVNLRRAQMLPFFKKRPRTEIAIEACGSAHHWARKLIALGHDVRHPAAIRQALRQACEERPQRRRGDLRSRRSAGHAFCADKSKRSRRMAWC